MSIAANSLRAVKRSLTMCFRDAAIDASDFEARELIMCVTGLSRTELVALSDQELAGDQVKTIEAFRDRRLSGEPLDSILGFREFYGRDYKVSKHVLSPRQETEHIVETALRFLKSVASPHILDLGTGSGAIVVTLLAEMKTASGTAVDISAGALKVAKANAKTHEVYNRIDWLEGAWFEPVTGQFDLIVSNPPYITDAAMKGLSLDVLDYDPDISLRGGQDGLNAYRVIIAGASVHLKAGGSLVFEIGCDQGKAVESMMTKAGFNGVTVEKDFAGHDRVVSGQWH